MEQERPAISDNDYRSQITEEAEVEAKHLGKGRKPILLQIQTQMMEEMEEEGEILETLEEGEIPRIPMQQEQHPQILTPIDGTIN